MSVTIDSLDGALEAVAKLGPVVREHAQAAEDQRRLPREVVDAFTDAGLWGVFAPVEVGGSGLGGLTQLFEIARAMAYEDSSAGWALFICGTTPMLLASKLPPEGRDEIFADGVSPTAGVFMPSGQGRVVDGGIVVNGRWQFGSGIAHSPYVMGNVVVVDDSGAPTPSGDMPFEIRAFVVPAEEVTIVDDWRVAGLRGTGSMSFAVEDVMVPDRRTFDFFAGPPTITHPKYRVPLFSSLGPAFAGLGAGIVRRMLDELIAYLPTRLRPPTFEPASADPTIQLSIGQAAATMRAVDESSRGIFGSYDARTDVGEDLAGLPMANRAEIHQHIVWVRDRCVETAAELFRLGGASSIYEPNILQRGWRDVSVMGQHAYVGTASHLLGAQLAFGQEVSSPLL